MLLIRTLVKNRLTLNTSNYHVYLASPNEIPKKARGVLLVKSRYTILNQIMITVNKLSDKLPSLHQWIGHPDRVVKGVITDAGSLIWNVSLFLFSQ